MWTLATCALGRMTPPGWGPMQVASKAPGLAPIGQPTGIGNALEDYNMFIAFRTLKDAFMCGLEERDTRLCIRIHDLHTTKLKVLTIATQ